MGNGICHCCLFCENGVQESPQTFLNPEIKIIFPLNMARAQAEAIQNHPSHVFLPTRIGWRTAEKGR